MTSYLSNERSDKDQFETWTVFCQKKIDKSGLRVNTGQEVGTMFEKINKPPFPVLGTRE